MPSKKPRASAVIFRCIRIFLIGSHIFRSLPPLYLSLRVTYPVFPEHRRQKVQTRFLPQDKSALRHSLSCCPLRYFLSESTSDMPLTFIKRIRIVPFSLPKEIPSYILFFLSLYRKQRQNGCLCRFVSCYSSGAVHVNMTVLSLIYPGCLYSSQSSLPSNSVTVTFLSTPQMPSFSVTLSVYASERL